MSKILIWITRYKIVVLFYQKYLYVSEWVYIFWAMFLIVLMIGSVISKYHLPEKIWKSEIEVWSIRKDIRNLFELIWSSHIYSSSILSTSICTASRSTTTRSDFSNKFSIYDHKILYSNWYSFLLWSQEKDRIYF